MNPRSLRPPCAALLALLTLVPGPVRAQRRPASRPAPSSDAKVQPPARQPGILMGTLTPAVQKGGQGAPRRPAPGSAPGATRLRAGEKPPAAAWKLEDARVTSYQLGAGGAAAGGRIHNLRQLGVALHASPRGPDSLTMGAPEAPAAEVPLRHRLRGAEPPGTAAWELEPARITSYQVSGSGAAAASGNNLRQLGLAVHSHHDARHQEPPPFVAGALADPGFPAPGQAVRERLDRMRYLRAHPDLARWLEQNPGREQELRGASAP